MRIVRKIRSSAIGDENRAATARRLREQPEAERRSLPGFTAVAALGLRQSSIRGFQIEYAPGRGDVAPIGTPGCAHGHSSSVRRSLSVSRLARMIRRASRSIALSAATATSEPPFALTCSISASVILGARASGGRLSVEGDNLFLETPEQLPDAVLNQLKLHKRGVRALLRLGWWGGDWQCGETARDRQRKTQKRRRGKR
jgi:hypothetical protein